MDPPREPPDKDKVEFLERPFGLPKWVKMEDYQRSPVCQLSSYNYKVEAKIGPTATSQSPRLTVFDTGAGPNLIRASLLPSETLAAIDRNKTIVKLTSASKHSLDVLGIVYLTLTVSTFRVRQPFVVVRQLGADVILGCTFINDCVEQIYPRQRKVILRNGDVVDIQCRPHGPLEEKPSNEDPTVPARPVGRFIRVAQRIILPPLSETNVLVTCGLSGTFFTESADNVYAKKGVSISNGVVTVGANRPFVLRIANFGRTAQALQKREKLGTVIPVPDHVQLIDFAPSDRSVECDSPSPLEEGEGCETQIASESDTHQSGVSPKSHTGLGAALQPPAERQGVHTRHDDQPPSVDDIPLDHLPGPMRKRVRKMLRKFARMWQGHLGELKVGKHRIELKPDAKPVFSQPRRAGPAAREAETEEVRKMLDLKVIEPASTEWASPIVLAPKPDGSWRFCVDYRRLNDITVKDSYPLPRMDECLDSLGEAKYFTTLDANNGYWQIPVAEEDRDKTTFTCHAGTYRFLRMPFGLCNAPATFQRAMDILLAGLRWKSCLVYLDDIIVFSRTAEEHLVHVEEILEKLQDAGVSLKLKKCRFFAETVDYLGHVIRPGLLEVATKNTAAIDGFEEPKTQTHLRSFLGVCNVYRRFVPNFAQVSAPLNELLKKGAPVELPPLNEHQRRSFNLLKQALKEPPILRLPRPSLPYSVDTDASDYQIGCALLQTHEDGSRYPIGFWSRSLIQAERNYSVSEKECLAVVWACTILRPYLERTHFDLYTDHQALKWMMNLGNASGRLERWRLRLMEYDFTVHYKKGRLNTIADCVSRLPTYGETGTLPDLEIPGLVGFLEEAGDEVQPTRHETVPMARQLRVVQTVRIHRSWSGGCRTSGSASRSLRKRVHARSESRIERPPTLSRLLRVGGNTPGNARERWHRDRHSACATFTVSAWGCRLARWGPLGCLSRTCGRNRTPLTRSCAFGTPTRG